MKSVITSSSSHFPGQLTYIGPKGYTLSKAMLTPMQEKQIKKDLMISPFNLMNQQNAAKGNFSFLQSNAFPVFRETSSKIFIPHHYGVKMFGPPSTYQVSQGVSIDVPFVGELRDYQQPVVARILEHFRESPVSGGLLEVPCGWGKTGAAMGIIAAMKLKTLVIVHKEFLMNQWIERISQFLPSARVGKIQGTVVDVEEKDIVLCMLQSLVSKPYSLELFQNFGITIIDEVHHISSESFSNALFKVKTKHMLGLSATLNRKDGTSFVIEWFLGPVIYKGERPESFDVLVKAYSFEDDDEDFGETMVDHRGNVMYSSMISKVGVYKPRIRYIAHVIQKEFAANPNQQMLVLSTTRSFLEELHAELDSTFRDSSDGSSQLAFYVGGMKEAKLKEAEDKKIILGTYAMASEGLDIKTLTSLVLATPKTDIEQSVGRILRVRHGQPLVIDIVDPHPVFVKQWKKRKAFYKKQKYSIENVAFEEPSPKPYTSPSFQIHPPYKREIETTFNESNSSEEESEAKAEAKAEAKETESKESSSSSPPQPHQVQKRKKIKK